MATYVPNAANWTIYRNGTHSGSSSTGTVITSITDGDSTDQKFTASDSISLHTSGGAELAGWKFLGTTTEIDGGPHLVFELKVGPNTFVYVVGTGPTATTGNVSAGQKEAPATVSGLNVNNADFTVCFFPGTLIATPSGELKVEDLVPGDPILIEDFCANPTTWIARMGRMFLQRFGFASAVPVKWIGRQTVTTRFGPAERLMPVRFAAGSLGGGGGATPSAT